MTDTGLDIPTRRLRGELARRENVLEWLEKEARALAIKGEGFEGRSISITRAMLAERGIAALEPAVRSRFASAWLTSSRTGLQLHYAKDVPKPRLRFSVAHELAHTYFNMNPEFRDPAVESLCDYFARCLLLPRELLMARIQELSAGTLAEDVVPPLHLAGRLAREFRVAPQAVVRRMVYDIYALPLALSCIAGDGAESERWRTSWFVNTAHSQDLIPAGGWLVPLSGNRLIPSEMVPQLPIHGTEWLSCDGRWSIGFRPAPPQVARRPFRYVTANESTRVLVAKVDEKRDLYNGLRLWVVVGCKEDSSH